MDNFLRQVVPIRDRGLFLTPIPADLAVPACATRDIARIAAELLLDPSWRGVDSIPILGPEDLSFNGMARIMSGVLGKAVRCQQITLEELKAASIGRGASEAMAQAMVNMMRAKSEGMDNQVQRTSPTTAPTSFRQWCLEVLKPALMSQSS
jgi:uncharacterized protein YbjT (DUF2867 family)